MKNYFITCVLLLSSLLGFAQTEVSQAITTLKKLVQINTFEKGAEMHIYEATGVMEYKQLSTIQRIKLADLGNIEVIANTEGYSVNVKCGDAGACVNFVKGDKTTAFENTAFLFNDAAIANTFAENMGTLVQHYKAPEKVFTKTLFRNTEGNAPVLTLNVAPKTETAGNTGLKENPGLKTNETEERDPELEKEKREEAKEQREELKKEKADAAIEKKELRRKAREERQVEKQEEKQDLEEEKTLSRKEKRKAAKEEGTEEEEADLKEKKPLKRNSLIEDVEVENKSSGDTKSENDFCVQLMGIINSGKSSGFKSIEGAETNASTKINESKIKLKGAKKNYLSWYKKERAFIAELKSGNNYEQIFKEYENIQTQLDECLGAGWDHEDKSNSEEYAKIKTEVKDVQYSNELDSSMPAIRIIMLEDDSKFSLFMRIK